MKCTVWSLMRCQSNCVTSSGVCVTRQINNKSILFFYSAIWSLAINSSGVKGIPEERAAQLSGRRAWRAMFSKHFTESHQRNQVKLPWTLLLSLCCAQCTNKPSNPSCRLSQRPSTGLYNTYLHMHRCTHKQADIQIQFRYKANALIQGRWGMLQTNQHHHHPFFPFPI